MRNIQVRNVPEATHEELTRRAKQSGKSLQKFLSEQLEAIAARPSPPQILDRIAGWGGGRLSSAEALTALESARARR